MQNSSARVRTKPYRGAYSKRHRADAGGLLCIIAGLITLLTTTAVYYVAMRRHNVELSFDQLSTFERQTRVVANRTLYVSEQHRVDAAHADLAVALARDDWAKVSAKIELVAYVFDDTSAFVGNPDWSNSVAHAFAAFDPPGLGIALFPCGCVVPNLFLRRSAARFGGLECAMLPGFVFPSQHVVWIDDAPGAHPCRGAARMHPPDWYARHEHKLGQARDDFHEMRARLIEKAKNKT